MKAQIIGVRYTHPVHGVFVLQFGQNGSVSMDRVYRSERGTMRTEKVPGKTRSECRAAMRARVTELDRQLGEQPANDNTSPEPACSGEGKVSCGHA